MYKKFVWIFKYYQVLYIIVKGVYYRKYILNNNRFFISNPPATVPLFFILSYKHTLGILSKM